MKQYILQIKDLEIPFCIKNYKTAKSMKMFFKEECLTITKSPYIPKREVEKFIKKNEERIYEEYKRINKQKEQKGERFENGKTIMYHGENYLLNISYHEKKTINIKIDENEKVFNILVPVQTSKEEQNYYIRKAIIKLFKRNTEIIIEEKLPYWSNVTNIKYSSVKVQDAKTKFGSCTVGTKALHFTSRLVMLKDEAIDAVIVHELCHIIHPNHSKDFYNLVEKYIPNYKQIDKYLKEISKEIKI